MSQKRDFLPCSVKRSLPTYRQTEEIYAHSLLGSIYGESEKLRRMLVLLWLGLRRPSRQTGRDPRRDRKRMDELAREYVQTRDKKIDKIIIEELYELGFELEKMEKLEKQ